MTGLVALAGARVGDQSGIAVPAVIAAEHIPGPHTDDEHGTWVTFPNGSRMPLRWHSDVKHAVAFELALCAVHGHLTRPRCGCRYYGEDLELQIRRRVSGGERSVVRHHLARMPNEGPRHRACCAFYEISSNRSGAAGYVRGVVRQREDGVAILKLARSLKFGRGPNAKDLVPAPSKREMRSGKATRPSMTLLGLLHFLWETAGLTIWHHVFEGRRNPWVVGRRLADAASRVVCGQLPLDDHLIAIVPGGARPVGALADLVERMGARHYVLLAGTVDRFDATAGRIDLLGARDHSLFVNCTPARMADMAARFPYAAQLLATERAGRPAQVMGLFMVKAKRCVWKGQTIVRAEVDMGALMEVTQHFVPVASALEQQVADRLVAEGRRFEKPLRYDASADLVFPDFVLKDTGHSRGCPMEVFGRDDASYQLRRAEKQAYYAETFGLLGWWQWIAAGPGKQDMPAFPNPVCRPRP